MTATQALLDWAVRATESYPNVKVTNFKSSWRNGLAFNAVIHRHRPDLVDMNRIDPTKSLDNLERAFAVAENELGVVRLLDPEDVDVEQPDEKSIMTYVASLYEVFPTMPPVVTATSKTVKKVVRIFF